jgi:hypothetical protein
MMSRGALDELTERVWSTRQQPVASEDFMKLATVVVEALSIAPNMMPYNADVELNCTSGYKPMERFSSDSRVNQTGDCEDQAREILNLARSLQCGSYSTSLVRVAQYVCRCYLATQQFGAVALGADPSLKVYSTGGNLFAHSFVIFIPASFVAASVVDAKLEDYMDSHHESGVQVLTTDGIALFDPNPLSPTHTCIASKLNSLRDLGADRTFANKLKCYSRIGNHYYMCSIGTSERAHLRLARACDHSPGGTPRAAQLQRAPRLRRHAAAARGRRGARSCFLLNGSPQAKPVEKRPSGDLRAALRPRRAVAPPLRVSRGVRPAAGSG